MLGHSIDHFGVFHVFVGLNVRLNFRFKRAERTVEQNGVGVMMIVYVDFEIVRSPSHMRTMGASECRIFAAFESLVAF